MRGPDKRRIALSIDKDVLDSFQKLAREMRMPSNICSVIAEEAFKKTYKILVVAREKKALNVVDLFQMIGEEMEEMQNEEPAQKTTGMEKKSRR